MNYAAMAIECSQLMQTLTQNSDVTFVLCEKLSSVGQTLITSTGKRIVLLRRAEFATAAGGVSPDRLCGVILHEYVHACTGCGELGAMVGSLDLAVLRNNSGSGCGVLRALIATLASRMSNLDEEVAEHRAALEFLRTTVLWTHVQALAGPQPNQTLPRFVYLKE
eukprot:TRINITY_DN2369_c0_g1_i1.p1 TRINITY_DN2369_c0_g1~~TRINITY_DN2369_c0_g1_i1.p1  ORF type:complete len:180 (-),score=1.48 TRINITY_DN2369_c0_g1_i1:165-659(-)